MTSWLKIGGKWGGHLLLGLILFSLGLVSGRCSEQANIPAINNHTKLQQDNRNVLKYLLEWKVTKSRSKLAKIITDERACDGWTVVDVIAVLGEPNRHYESPYIAYVIGEQHVDHWWLTFELKNDIVVRSFIAPD